MSGQLRDEDYRQLLLLRTGLRRFIRQSESFAREAGLTPAQHQLLLAIRGHDVAEGPTIGDVAKYLLLRHHSTVELVNRAVATGLVLRCPDAHDARAVRLSLTDAGKAALARLSERNLEELARLADRFRPLWHGLGGDDAHDAAPVLVARTYDGPDEGGRTRVLVDRLWPRGLHKNDAPFDQWLPEVAPSSDLRRWYGHRVDRFEEFAARYRDELRELRSTQVAALLDAARSAPLMLLTATSDIRHSAAAVLAEELKGLLAREPPASNGRARATRSRPRAGG